MSLATSPPEKILKYGTHKGPIASVKLNDVHCRIMLISHTMRQRGRAQKHARVGLLKQAAAL